MEEKEKIELGRIKVELPIPYLSVLALAIEEEKNKHGRLQIKLMVKGDTSEARILSLENASIKVKTPDGECMFSGVILDIHAEIEAEYKEIEIGALSHSCKADIKKNSRTFQDPAKTLSFVAKSVLSASGAKLVVQDDTTIPHIIYQQNETDWHFVVRIANQYGIPVFTDCRQEGILISLGPLGFQTKQLDSSAYEKAEVKNLSELRKIQGNTNSNAAAFSFGGNQILSNDLTIATGDAVGGDFVSKNSIVVTKELVENNIFLYKKESVKSSCEEMTGTALVSNVITGTVLAVKENDIQVKFDVDGEALGSEMWIPYECAINNSFYCMPDVGDKVFVYYENNGKIACLGSKHVNTGHPDFSKKDEKTMTANNKMIRFMPKSLDITTTRDKYDNDDEQQISICMDDESGITINSGHDIVITSEQNIMLSGMEKPLESIDTSSSTSKFKELSDAGRQKYHTEGGLSDTELAEKAVDKWFKDKGDKLIKNFKETGQGLIFYDLWHKAPADDQMVQAPESFETGTVTLYGYEKVRLEVGNSIIELSDHDISFIATEFEWLGFTHNKHEEQSKENRDWWDTILDGVQLALDVMGMFPVFGFVPDLINAGISLLRGDVAGAMMSAFAAIPGIGDAAGAVKIVSKGAKLIKKFDKIIKIAKMIYAGANCIATVIRNKDAIVKLYKVIRDGKFDITNPKDWDMVVTTLQTAQTFGDTAKDIHDATSKKKTDADGGDTKKNDGNDSKNDSDAEASQKYKDLEKQALELDAEDKVKDMNKKDSNDQDNPKEKDTKADDNEECPGDGEPVHMVTGSFLVDHTDITLEDILQPFHLKRSYQSVYANDDRMAGKHWYFNIETRLTTYQGIFNVQLPDGHNEKFLQTTAGFENKRRGDRTYILSKLEEGYYLKDHKHKVNYTYNKKGLITAIEDINSNKTKFTYEHNVLKELILASGQKLSFTYHNGLVETIQDNLNRQIKYEYKKGNLTAVTYPNGGKIRYDYNQEGYIRSITDQNDNNYVTNYYDKKGRVVRQIVSNGEEYIYLYNERERVNSIIVSSTGREVQYYYDKNDRVYKQVFKDGTYEEVEFDVAGNVIYERDRKGNVTFHKYDEMSHLLEETSSSGHKISYEYDDNGNVVHKVDNAGAEEMCSYDNKGNLLSRRVRLTKNSWAETSYRYDGCGRMVEVTDANGNTSTYEYETGFSKPTAYKNPEGAYFQYRYDSAGRLMTIRDEFGRISYGYNSMDYRTFIEDNDGNCTKYVYDKMNNLIKIIYPNQYDETTGEGLGITYEYDEMDTMYRMTDALGNVVSTPLNCEGKIIKEINPNTYDPETQDGQGIVYEYDFNSYRTKVFQPDGGIKRLKYDVKGNLMKQINPMEYHTESDDGDGYEFEYDSEDRLILVRNPLGVVEKYYEYDLSGKIVKEVGAKGYLENGLLEDYDGTEHIGALFQYNLAGWRTEVREPVKLEGSRIYYKLTRYEYDKVGNKTAELRYLDYQTEDSAIGRELRIQYQYDKNGRLVQIYDSLGACLQYRYNSNNKIIFERRKINEETSLIQNYEYNSIGRLTRIYQLGADLDGEQMVAITTYDYDKTGNLIRIKTPTGHEIRRAFDVADRLITEWHKGADGEIDNRIDYTYDKAGNMTAQMDSNGKGITTVYDTLNREVKSTLKNGGSWLTSYDLNGRVSGKIAPNEYAIQGEKARGWKYSYDPLGNLISVVDMEGTRTTYNRYNRASEVLEETDAVGNGVQFSYDFAGRRISIKTAGNSTQEYEYDAIGNIIGIIDGNQNRTSYITDTWGRTVEVHTPDDAIEEYLYDYAGNIIRAKDGNGNQTTFHYNSWNEVQNIVDQTGNVERFDYDLEGNQSFYQDRNGNTVFCQYNMYGSLTEKHSGDGSIRQFYHYYRDGALKSAVSDGMRYDYTYYGDGKLKDKSASGKTLLHFAYDLNGNCIKQADLTGKVAEYRYDFLDRLQEIYDNGNKIASYQYYPDGMVKQIQAGKNMLTEYGYDADRNISSLKTSLNGEMLVDNTYAYDGNGNRTAKRGLWGETQYGYDTKNQLVKAVYPTYSEELFYDKAGNRIKRLANGIEEQYEYDERNRLMKQSFVNPINQNVQKVKEFSYDAQGNLLTDGEKKFTYDTFNRAVKTKTADANIQVNRYDAENLRYEVEENGKLVQFLFQNREVVAEKTVDQVVRYVRDEYTIVASDCENARTYYHYASDELGSTTHVINGENEVVNRYLYDAFGNTVECEEQVANRFRFCGQQWDTTTGQYYLRARYYNPVIGRFTQEDTYRGDGLNLYAYCHGNPVGYGDPSGNMTRVQCRKYNLAREKGKDVVEAYSEATGYMSNSESEVYKDLRSKGMGAAEAYNVATGKHAVNKAGRNYLAQSETKRILDHYADYTTKAYKTDKKHNPKSRAHETGSRVHKSVADDILLNKNRMLADSPYLSNIQIEQSYLGGKTQQSNVKGSRRMDIIITNKVNTNVVVGDIKTGKAKYRNKQRNGNEIAYGRKTYRTFTHMQVKPYEGWKEVK